MNLKRFEILLPLNYNDGRPIEREKFLLTHRELIRQFGATTVDTTRASGTWVYCDWDHKMADWNHKVAAGGACAAPPSPPFR